MPEIQLDDLTLIVIQPGEGGADAPCQFGSLGVVAANGRRASDIGRLASDIGRLASDIGRRASDIGRRASDIGCLVRTVQCPVRHVNRRLVPWPLLPVRFDPESESGTVYAEFLGHLSDRPGEINYHLGGFTLKFRRIPFRILAPSHLIPPFPM
jgi:hypothetical protein